jgi:membrane protein implicated in regulation of membrane protease activity
MLDSVPFFTFYIAWILFSVSVGLMVYFIRRANHSKQKSESNVTLVLNSQDLANLDIEHLQVIERIANTVAKQHKG